MKLRHYNILLAALIATFLLYQISFIYQQYTNAIDDFGYTAMNISKAVQQVIDIREYEKLITTRERTPYFYKMQDYFSGVQKSTGSKYVYVERALNDTEIEYIFDSYGDSLGQRDENSTQNQYKTKNLNSFYTSVIDYKLWGKLITGYSPILNGQGSVIGLVGVDFTLDLSLKNFFKDLRQLLIYMLVVATYFATFAVLMMKRKTILDRDIINLYTRIFNALSRSLEKKSEYTFIHSKKVAEYSVILSKELGIPDKNIKTIDWAASLHDIGKIGIPEKILNKPSRLTDEEYELIKQHPVYSKDILSEIFCDSDYSFNRKELSIITNIACYHHERWDGNGYPYGLKGEEIPLMARIVSIADAWEAMTADRPYKQTMDKNLALEEIKNNSGKQFDPDITDVFVKCIEKRLI
jgi:HD-GYP domain-containing protein (c-di-GMP phosphodiesterase class II)